MSSTNTAVVLDIGRFGYVYAVAFHPDGEHVLGGSRNGIRRWRLSDGQEVTKQMGMELNAISVSRDGKRIVCGTDNGASVWDGEMRGKVVDVESGGFVWAVDVSPDSTRLVTGTNSGASNIWSIETGERLVGPLKHVNPITGVQFSPNGEHIATACFRRSIRVFDSRNGDELITIDTTIPTLTPANPLAWSSDGQQIFATSKDNKIRAFDVSTGSQLAEMYIPSDRYDVYSLALAPNGKFIVTFGDRSISFLDTSTRSRTGPVIVDSERIRSIAISQDSSYIATGRFDGKIVIRHLNSVLADLYGPFHASTREELRQDRQPSTSGNHNSKENPGKPSHLEFEGDSIARDGDLNHEVPSSTPAPQSFDYDEPLSTAASVNLREDEIPPLAVGSSHLIAQSSDGDPPVTRTSPVEACREEILESSKGTMVVKRWLQTRFRKGDKEPVSHTLDRLSGKSREPQAVDRRSPSHSPPRADDRQEGPSRMAAAMSKITKRPTRKSRSKTTTAQHPNEDASRGRQGAADVGENPTQQSTNPPQPSPAGVHLSHQRESGYGTLRFSIRYPMWLLCCCSDTHDGTH